MVKQININGMTCKHCIMHVANALKDVDGVEEVEVNLEYKNAIVKLIHDVEGEKLREAVEEAGYEVTAVSDLK